jgi:hypothetical protein
MCRFSSRWALFSLLGLLGFTAGDTSTTVVSVTSTTTVHVTATDYAGACDNFVGACVVYGTAGNAPYTTTVYVGQSPPPPPPPTVTTSTTIILATTTASNRGDCSNFVGACVVYASNSASAAPVSTVYYNGDNNHHNGLGNNQGYIGQAEGGSDGYIGSASVHKWSCMAAMSVVTLFGLMIWI